MFHLLNFSEILLPQTVVTDVAVHTQLKHKAKTKGLKTELKNNLVKWMLYSLFNLHKFNRINILIDCETFSTLEGINTSVDEKYL